LNGGGNCDPGPPDPNADCDSDGVPYECDPCREFVNTLPLNGGTDCGEPLVVGDPDSVDKNADCDLDGLPNECDPCIFFFNTLPVNGGGGCGGAAPDDNADCNGDNIPNECQCGDANEEDGLIGFDDATCLGQCFLGGGQADPPCNCWAGGDESMNDFGKAEGNNDGLRGFEDPTAVGNAFLTGKYYEVECPVRPEGWAAPGPISP